MRINVLKAGLLAVALVAAAPAPSSAASVSIGVNIGVFHDRLAPYGDWVTVGRYGTCWRPRRVVRTWRPYTDGYWTYTDYGWTWVSNEDWGWATYHYGRWYYDPYYGWVWVPGTRWAPAYVTWRSSGDWVGWAPLPPGTEPGVFVNVNVRPSAYSFVETRHFLDQRLGGRFAPESRNAFLIGSTRNVTRYNVEGGRIINRGVDVRQIERVSGRSVEQLHVRDSAVATRPRVSNNELSVYRPSADRNNGQRSRATAEAPRVERRGPQPEQRQPQIERRQAAPRIERDVQQAPVTRHERQTAQPRAERQMRAQQQPRAEQQPRPERQPRAEQQRRTEQPPRTERQPRPEHAAPSHERREAPQRQERATTGQAPSRGPQGGEGNRHGDGGEPRHGGGGARGGGGDQHGGGADQHGGDKGGRKEGDGKHKKG